MVNIYAGGEIRGDIEHQINLACSVLHVSIHIIVSLHVMTFIEMIKWAYLDVLLNPVLSDSFGLSLGVSSYFYLALAVPRILGSVLL